MIGLMRLTIHLLSLLRTRRQRREVRPAAPATGHRASWGTTEGSADVQPILLSTLTDAMDSGCTDRNAIDEPRHRDQGGPSAVMDIGGSSDRFGTTRRC